MPRNGSGGYTLPVNSWNPAVNGVTATSADWQAIANDLKAAIQGSISADGQTPITSSISLNNNKLTFVADATLDGDAINKKQFDTGITAVNAGIAEVNFADYPALRAYTGNKDIVYITGSMVFTNPQGIAGTFKHDAADTTSADNGGTIIVTTSGRRYKRQFEGVVNAGWFGLSDNLAVNSSIPLQAAYDYLMTANGGTIEIPFSKVGYVFNTALNFTDAWKPIKIKGMGASNIPNGNNLAYGTHLWANTGSVLFDISGRHNFSLEDVVLSSMSTAICTTPSRIGVLGARTTTSPDNQNHRFQNVAMFMRTSGNPALPSIGHYAYGTELGSYDNCWYFADIPAVYCLANVYNITSPFKTLLSSGVSATANSMTACRYVSKTGRPAVHLDGTYDNHFKQSYFYNELGTSTTSAAVLLTGYNHSLVIDTFQCEEYNNMFECTGSLFSSKIKGFNVSSTAVAGAPLGKFTGAQFVVDNEFDIEQGGIGVEFDAYTGTLAAGAICANNQFTLGQYGNVNIANGAGGTFSNLAFTRWNDAATIKLTGAGNTFTYTLNGKTLYGGKLASSISVPLTYNALPNNTDNNILSFTVPNATLNGLFEVTYLLNSSVNQRNVSGKVLVSLARVAGSAMVVGLSTVIGETSLLLSGTETLPVTFSLSGIFDPVTGAQYCFLRCKSNSNLAGTSYVRGTATALQAMLNNNTVTSADKIIVGTL